MSFRIFGAGFDLTIDPLPSQMLRNGAARGLARVSLGVGRSRHAPRGFSPRVEDAGNVTNLCGLELLNTAHREIVFLRAFKARANPAPPPHQLAPVKPEVID